MRAWRQPGAVSNTDPHMESLTALAARIFDIAWRRCGAGAPALLRSGSSEEQLKGWTYRRW